MAIRSFVFRSGFRFDERIGPDGSNMYAMGSETSFTQRLETRGQRCFHVPGAIVKHMIRPTQMTREFALKRAYRAGRGKGMLAHDVEHVAEIAGVPRYFLGNVARAVIGFGMAWLRRDTVGEFKAAWHWNHARGCIDGARAALLNAAEPSARPQFDGAPSPSAPTPA